jgi:hypothetical protein
MERKVLFSPAYDKVKEGYGRHGVEILFALVGDQGAASFTIYTNWMIPYSSQEAKIDGVEVPFPPCGADISYHSPVPLRKGHKGLEKCLLIKGMCYTDGSGLLARDIFKQFVKKGEEVIWKALQKYYDNMVNEIQGK